MPLQVALGAFQLDFAIAHKPVAEMAIGAGKNLDACDVFTLESPFEIPAD